MNIVLIGYMGCGKSTVARYLSNILDVESMDLDAFIERQEGKTISSLFNDKGEIYFRKKESLYLKDLLHVDRPKILALGGGTPCYGNNINIIKNHSKSKSFYLKTPISVLVDRLRKEKEKRPLISHIQTDDDLMEFVGKHLFERTPFYMQSDYIIETGSKSVKDIGEAIVGCLF